MDWLDEVCFVEEKIFEEGKQSGEHFVEKPDDESADNNLEDERICTNQGYLSGFALGLEIGFMRAVVEECNDQDIGDRMSKRHKELIARATALPSRNDHSVDFEQELRDLRALYKQCGDLTTASKVGAFLRVGGQQTQLIENDAQSNTDEEPKIVVPQTLDW